MVGELCKLLYGEAVYAPLFPSPGFVPDLQQEMVSVFFFPFSMMLDIDFNKFFYYFSTSNNNTTIFIFTYHVEKSALTFTKVTFLAITI
jgi:hypothetical protein